MNPFPETAAAPQHSPVAQPGSTARCILDVLPEGAMIHCVWETDCQSRSSVNLDLEVSQAPSPEFCLVGQSQPCVPSWHRWPSNTLDSEGVDAPQPPRLPPFSPNAYKLGGSTVEQHGTCKRRLPAPHTHIAPHTATHIATSTYTHARAALR